MKKRIYFLLMLAFCFTSLNAQEENAFVTTGLSDDMTVNPEQNALWRTGESVFSSKPKNPLELGVHFGHFAINGDVPEYLPAGFGVGLHLRKAFNYALSWRLDGMFSQSRGLDGRLSTATTLMGDNGKTLRAAGKTLTSSTYRNYKAQNISGIFSVLVNVGNVLFHQEENKWNFYVGGGLGLTSAVVDVNYFDSNGSQYNWDAIESKYGSKNSRDKRKAIKDALDDTYETESTNDRNVPGINDTKNIIPSFVGTAGISRKITDKFNVSLEHQVFLQDFDKWDGHEWRVINTRSGDTDMTNDSDIAHYTNLRLGINLGEGQPLYWVNPLAAPLNDIAALKRRPVLDLTDTDGDGVIDMIDQEPESREGCAVNTMGVVIDSDGDGLVDCDDKEVYSPAGYEIDENGVHIPNCTSCLTEDDVNRIIKTTVPPMIPKPAAPVAAGCSDWFLPMIHFDNDKSRIKPEFFGQLHNVADVAKLCPNVCIDVVGHTDKKHSDDYNLGLSYKRAQAAINHLVTNYGISGDRLNLKYGGETTPLTSNATNYMNRRVEFKVGNCGDADMGMPAGAVETTTTSGSYYSGNKNSGY